MRELRIMKLDWGFNAATPGSSYYRRDLAAGRPTTAATRAPGSSSRWCDARRERAAYPDKLWGKAEAIDLDAQGLLGGRAGHPPPSPRTSGPIWIRASCLPEARASSNCPRRTCPSFPTASAGTPSSSSRAGSDRREIRIDVTQNAYTIKSRPGGVWYLQRDGSRLPSSRVGRTSSAMSERRTVAPGRVRRWTTARPPAVHGGEGAVSGARHLDRSASRRPGSGSIEASNSGIARCSGLAVIDAAGNLVAYQDGRCTVRLRPARQEQGLGSSAGNGARDAGHVGLRGGSPLPPGHPQGPGLVLGGGKPIFVKSVSARWRQLRG